MKLTKKQRDQLWGDSGPYSEAQIIIESRILDDMVSRIFVYVEVHINPFTFEYIKKHRNHFADDMRIQQLLDHSEFRGQPHGYISLAFSKQYTDEQVMGQAQVQLEEAKQTIIKMHRFVMEAIKR